MGGGEGGGVRTKSESAIDNFLIGGAASYHSESLSTLREPDTPA